MSISDFQDEGKLLDFDYTNEDIDSLRKYLFGLIASNRQTNDDSR
jgi:hypothetical protein